MAGNKIAVVTGGNKGIGLEICRQLAFDHGVTVVLGARDQKRGLEAAQKLNSDLIVFHQLDVSDPASIAAFAEFVKTKFGKLDILVNNAGSNGLAFDAEKGVPVETYESSTECFKTNYYGVKGLTEALAPLLKLSDSPRIVNVASSMALLKAIPNEWAKEILKNAEHVAEEKIDEVVETFLKDFKEGALEAKKWPAQYGAYILSKAVVIAYTTNAAKKYPSFKINSLCPGFVKTDINFNTGVMTVEQGAATPVKLALLPDDGPSGKFYNNGEVASIEE